MNTVNVLLAFVALLAVVLVAMAWWQEPATQEKVRPIVDWFAGRVPSAGRHGLRAEHLGRAVTR